MAVGGVSRVTDEWTKLYCNWVNSQRVAASLVAMSGYLATLVATSTVEASLEPSRGADSLGRLRLTCSRTGRYASASFPRCLWGNLVATEDSAETEVAVADS